jgi:hypothetical protein
MGFLVYDTYAANKFFHKVTNFFMESFNAKMKIFLKERKHLNYIKNTQEYKNFSLFLCNCFSECPCDCKSVILSNEQIRIFLSSKDAIYNNVSEKGDSGLALLFDAKFNKLKGTTDFNYLFAVDDAGKIENFASAVVKTMHHYKSGTDETQTTDIFFKGIINSIKNNDEIHYIVNESFFPNNNSPGYNSFSVIYFNKKGVTPTAYCSVKNPKCDCKLLRKISFIMTLLRR